MVIRWQRTTALLPDAREPTPRTLVRPDAISLDTHDLPGVYVEHAEIGDLELGHNTESQE
jgi:hypothetical protein